MRRPKTLPAFDGVQQSSAHRLLATQVAFMRGRKLEEGDWSSVYCRAKGIPNRGWSNLQIDVMYQGLGVEHKMLSRPPDKPIKSFCGTRLMHPSATRSIRISSISDPANDVMQNVLGQYADLIEQRRVKVREAGGRDEADLRIGWLLWQNTLTEFLYFEEEMLSPDPNDYWAEWEDKPAAGSRKASRNLWIFENETKQKRYSVTTGAGPKIQPYFDVPPPTDPNLYYFRVQGEEISPGMVRIWVPVSLAAEVRRLLGDTNAQVVSDAIAMAAAQQPEDERRSTPLPEEATEILITRDAYGLLVNMFPSALSDAHRAEQLVAVLRGV